MTQICGNLSNNFTSNCGGTCSQWHRWTFGSGTSCMIQKKNKWTNLHPRSNQNWMVSKVLKHLENLLNIVPSFGPVFSLISIQEGRRKSLKCHEKVIFSWSLCKKNQCFFFLDFHSNVAYLRVGLLKVPAFPWTKISKHPRTFNSLPPKTVTF